MGDQAEGDRLSFFFCGICELLYKSVIILPLNGLKFFPQYAEIRNLCVRIETLRAALLRHIVRYRPAFEVLSFTHVVFGLHHDIAVKGFVGKMLKTRKPHERIRVRFLSLAEISRAHQFTPC